MRPECYPLICCTVWRFGMSNRSNRYPRGMGAVARDYRSRPQPDRREWLPDNDNKPGWKPPKPKPWIPDNDNRPVPNPRDWSFSRPPRVPGWARWARRFAKVLLGPLGAALTLYELWELWQWYQEQAGMRPPGSERVVCSERNPGVYPMESYRWLSIVPVCSHGIAPVGEGAWSDTERWLTWWQGYYIPPPFNQERWIPVESNYYPSMPDTPPVWQPEYRWPWVEPYVPPDLPKPWDNPWTEPLRPYPRQPRNPRPDDKLQPERPKLPEDKVSDEPEFRPKPPDPKPRPRRPRKDERERKIRIKDMPNMRMRRILGWILSAASEGGDFLDSLYEALPDSLQHKDDGMAEKFDKVFKNLDKVDFTEAVNNLITNQVEDRYFGKGFGDMSDALEDFGIELPTLKL